MKKTKKKKKKKTNWKPKAVSSKFIDKCISDSIKMYDEAMYFKKISKMKDDNKYKWIIIGFGGGEKDTELYTIDKKDAKMTKVLQVFGDGGLMLEYRAKTLDVRNKVINKFLRIIELIRWIKK